MEFWLIMIAFIVMGGSCSLAGTWWDRKNKKDKKEEKIVKLRLHFRYGFEPPHS